MQGMIFKDKVSKLKWDMANKRKTKKIKKIIKHHVQKNTTDLHGLQVAL